MNGHGFFMLPLFSFPVSCRSVHRISQFFPLRISSKVVDEQLHDPVQRLLQVITARDMRRQKQVFAAPQRMIRRQRFGICHIKGGTGQPAALEGMQKSVLIDRCPPPHIQQDAAFLHRRKPLSVHYTMGLGRVGERHHHNISLGKKTVQVFKGADLFKVFGAGCFRAPDPRDAASQMIHLAQARSPASCCPRLRSPAPRPSNAHASGSCDNAPAFS